MFQPADPRTRFALSVPERLNHHDINAEKPICETTPGCDVDGWEAEISPYLASSVTREY
jgi:hypothetical protein